MDLRKGTIVICCFLITGFFNFMKPDSYGVEKTQRLSEVFTPSKGWQPGPSIPLDYEIVKELKLDDYVNQNFSRDIDSAFLYIGYYLTSKNVGAAHSPLVCFPGQGWLLIDLEEKQISTEVGHINLASVIASTPEEQLLLIYWFQAFEQTSPGTLIQKLNLMRTRLVDRREDNAFVRITVPLKDRTRNQAFTLGADFIKAFYPAFLNYIHQTASVPLRKGAT